MRRTLSTVKLKHLNQSGFWPSGNPRFYYRPKGEKGKAMPDFPMDHPKFLAAYAAASGVQPMPQARAGSIAAAIIAYKKSDDFKLALKESTRSRRRTTLDDITAKYGPGKVADLRDSHIRLDLKAFSGHARNNRLKVWRAFGAFIEEEYELTCNPAAAVSRSKVPSTGGHKPWTLDEVDAFRAHWPLGSMERLTFELVFWTGARISDAVQLGASNVDRQGWLTYNQVKTKDRSEILAEVSVPFRRDLPEFAQTRAADLAFLHSALDARPTKHFTFITTEFQRARSPKGASQWFAKAARAAGIEGKTAHGLRKLRSQLSTENGATTHQVAAWLGHESLKEVENYSKKFGRKLALTNTKAEQESSNFQSEVPSLTEKG